MTVYAIKQATTTHNIKLAPNKHLNVPKFLCRIWKIKNVVRDTKLLFNDKIGLSEARIIYTKKLKIVAQNKLIILLSFQSFSLTFLMQNVN